MEDARRVREAEVALQTRMQGALADITAKIDTQVRGVQLPYKFKQLQLLGWRPVHLHLRIAWLTACLTALLETE
jgi:hypothetical protein